MHHPLLQQSSHFQSPLLAVTQPQQYFCPCHTFVLTNPLCTVLYSSTCVALTVADLVSRANTGPHIGYLCTIQTNCKNPKPFCFGMLCFVRALPPCQLPLFPLACSSCCPILHSFMHSLCLAPSCRISHAEADQLQVAVSLIVQPLVFL